VTEHNKAFNKAAIFTDIHYGLKNNSEQHNKDCNDFVDWFIEQSLDLGCETFIFMGDWHHSRHTINVSTLNHSVAALEKLIDNFEKTYMIIGNHDLYYRDRRDVHSLVMSKGKDVHLIEEITQVGDAVFAPWLVGEEWKDLSKMHSTYLFGHFEFPKFLMNANFAMPDKENHIQIDHVGGFKHVYSGHFHKRQERNNVKYVGNPFGHNYADAWDFDRGMATLEWGSDVEYINYDGPKYLTCNLSEINDKAIEHVDDKTYLKIIVDIDSSYENTYYLREILTNQYGVREIRMENKSLSINELENTQEVDEVHDNVDQVILKRLNNIETESYDKNLLTEIYKEL